MNLDDEHWQSGHFLEKPAKNFVPDLCLKYVKTSQNSEKSIFSLFLIVSV